MAKDLTMAPKFLCRDRTASPIGTIALVVDDEGVLRAIDFEDHEARMLRLLRRHYGATDCQTQAVPRSVTDALEAYFAGALDALRSIAWATAGTQFQQAVWTALTLIPRSTTCTYGALAARLGKPGACRAVGLANGANPVGIVVPCHRVIGADGALTGYGGGLHRKHWLLAHEGAIPRRDLAADLFSA